jgi:hypothetical protein
MTSSSLVTPFWAALTAKDRRGNARRFQSEHTSTLGASKGMRPRYAKRSIV